MFVKLWNTFLPKFTNVVCFFFFKVRPYMKWWSCSGGDWPVCDIIKYDWPLIAAPPYTFATQEEIRNALKMCLEFVWIFHYWCNRNCCIYVIIEKAGLLANNCFLSLKWILFFTVLLLSSKTQNSIINNMWRLPVTCVFLDWS